MTNIVIQNLSKTIKKNVVIQDISMELQSGTVYGFKGINGSGENNVNAINLWTDSPYAG